MLWIDKNTFICDVGIAQCDDKIVKCEKQIIENYGTTKCDKSTVTCEIIVTVLLRIFVIYIYIYIRQLLGNSVGLVGLATLICNVGSI